eukprot:UC1_evm1s1510
MVMILHFVTVAAFIGALLPVHAGSSSFPTRYEVYGRVLVPKDVTDVALFASQTRVLLDGGEHETGLRADGSFVFVDLPTASYSLEVACPTHAYPMLRVDVNRKFHGNVRVFTADFAGAASGLTPERHD